MDEKELKRKIRALKKLKKTVKVGSSIRRQLNRQIREFQYNLNNLYGDVTPEKRKVIEKIQELDPMYQKLQIDLNKFTLEQLQYHINKVERKKR